jgi:hypothetical protein
VSTDKGYMYIYLCHMKEAVHGDLFMLIICCGLR